jgi:hypothetical protein
MKEATIYMELLDEGTDCWRPIQVETLPDNLYRVIGPVPSEEIWAFAPGSIVRGEPKIFGDGREGIVAVEYSN